MWLTPFLILQNSVALASVTLPANLFASDAAADCKLQFVAFRTGSFFPLTGNSSTTTEHSRRRTVNSPVVFVGLGKETFSILKRLLLFIYLFIYAYLKLMF